jgi:hypothetical protein
MCFQIGWMGFFFSLSLVMGGATRGGHGHWLLGGEKVEIHVGKSHVSQTLKFHHKVLRNP